MTEDIAYTWWMTRGWLLCLLMAWVIILFGTSAYSQESAPVATLLDKGVDLLQNNKLDEALSVFNNIVLVEPSNAEAHFRIGQVYMQQRDAEEGLRFIKKSTELNPKDVRFSLNLATIYERQKKFQPAIDEYQRVINSGTNDTRIKEAAKRLDLLTGRLLAQKNELNPALLIFNGLLIEYPDDPQVLFNIGSAYLLLNRVTEAESTFLKLAQLDPKNGLVHFNLATIFERTGREQQALKHLQLIIDLDRPGDFTTASKIRFGIISGRLAFAQQQWEPAIALFRRVVALDKTNKEALFNIALAHLRMGNTDEAEQVFLAVIKEDTNDFSARLNLGQVYADLGRIDDATAQLQYVIDNDKAGRYRKQANARMNFIHTQLADEALSEGDVAESLRQYQQALEFYSGNVKASFTRGMIFIRQKKYDLAKIEFENVIRYDSRNLRGRLNLAGLYEQLQQLTLAAEQYEFIIQINKDSNEGQIAQRKWKITKARGLWADQRLSDAEKLFESILKTQADNLEAYYYLGIIQASKGKLRQAASSYQSLLGFAPNNQQVRMLLAKIYEQLQLEELAAQEYRTILFNGAAQNVMDEAELRLDIVESRLSGFSRNMSYQFSYDSNVNFNDQDPAEEARSNLSFNVTYSVKLKDDLSLRLGLSPSYSSLHENQSDFFRSNVQAEMQIGTSDKNWNISISQQKQEALSTETSLSKSDNFRMVLNKKLFLPAMLGLSPPGFENDNIATNLSTNLGVVSISSFSETPPDSVSLNVGVRIGQSLKWGVSIFAGYNLNVNRNLVNAQRRPANTITVTDPVTGLDETQVNPDNAIFYDSRDYERMTHSLSTSISKTLAPGLRGTLSTSLAFANYSNIDSGAKVREENRRRDNLTGTLSANVSYQFHQGFRFFSSASLTKNISNLPTGQSQQLTADDAIVTFQSASLGAYNRFSLSTGIAMSF